MLEKKPGNGKTKPFPGHINKKIRRVSYSTNYNFIAFFTKCKYILQLVTIFVNVYAIKFTAI